METIIVLPTFNEASNLEPLVAELLSLPLDDAGILIVDDQSPDGTGQIADRLHEQHPTRVSVIHRHGKLGLGTAYVTGFRWALEHGAAHIIQMDCDFSHSPSYLPKFVAQMDQYDVVVGSRYVPGGKLDPRWSASRELLSRWANSVWVRFILGLRVRDATAGFKCWNRRALEGVLHEDIRSNGYVFQIEMAYLAEKQGLHILEWPIFFEDRRIGKSKMSIPVKLEAAWRVFEIRWRHGGLNQDQARVEWRRDAA